MPAEGLQKKFSRDLRFRLTAGHLVFLVFLLVVVGLFFRSTLVVVQESQARELLDEDFAALSTFLQRGESGLVWNYDSSNPQDSFLVERLQRVLLLADEDGNLLQVSPAYRVIGVESSGDIRRVLRTGGPAWATRSDPWGTNYLIRMGVFMEPGGQRYFVAQGRNTVLTEATVRQFTWRYFAALPVIVLAAGLLGWLLTRRGLKPLNGFLNDIHT